MWQPRSIRLHLAAVFLLFFALVAGLGAFSMWRLANFNSLSADVAEVWLPTTRALGDLNNYTSDFRAFEGNALLTSDPDEVAATEKQMTELDRAIAGAERNFEHIRHDAAEAELYVQFKAHWTAYRGIVNQMLVLAHTNATHLPSADFPIYDPDVFYSMHTPTGANFLFGDGSVHYITSSINPNAYQYLATIAGGDGPTNW